MSRSIEMLTAAARRSRLSRREFFQRSAALGVSTVMAQSIFTRYAAASPVKGGILRAGMVGGETTNSLDPGTWQSQVPYTFGRCWGEQMLEVSPDGELEARLAEEWEASDDAMTWIFKIRKGVTFHNGKDLTPADVVATLERHADEESQSAALPFVEGIRDMRIDGDHVVITLGEPNADLPYFLTDYHLMIQPDGGRDDPTAGIGTGPYRIAENQPGVRHVGERNADYWASDVRGHADQIEIVVMNDATARMSAVQSGEVHLINRIEPNVVHMVERAPGVVVRNATGKAHYVMVAHCDASPFDNNDLRLALKYAVDRQQMVDTVLGGYGTIGNDLPVNDSYAFFADDIEQRSYDPDRAAHHFRKSGHDGPIVLRTSDVAFPGAVNAAQLFQQSAAQAGIEVEVRREPGDGYWSEVWNKQPFSMSYWTGRPTQDQVYSLAYLSDAQWNDTRFFREDFDKLIVEARGELDADRRTELYGAAARILHDEGGLITPMFNNNIDATRESVQGWVDDPHGELMAGHALTKCWLDE